VARIRRTARRPSLSGEVIEKTALVLIERDGMDAFSIRGLAAELGCEPMSIYHYFPSRQHLLDALLDRVLGTLPPVRMDLPPIDRLRQLALDNRDLAHRFPQFYRYLAYHRLNTPGGIRFIAGILQAFDGLGLSLEETARLFRAIGYYITGGALDETSGYAKGYSAANPVPVEVIERDYPMVAAINPWFKPEHHERTFVAGLDILLAGIAGRAKRGGTRARRRR
jgi:AcrR family transcriptional regulator